MESEEYKIQISQPDVLDHTTLNITLKEFAFLKDVEITTELNRVLLNNLIEKPRLHAQPYDTATNYYKVDLSPELLERIIDLLNDLEARNIAADGETTPTAAFYGSLADKWSALG